MLSHSTGVSNCLKYSDTIVMSDMEKLHEETENLTLRTGFECHRVDKTLACMWKKKTLLSVHLPFCALK